MVKKRKDNKGRVLKKGESQRKDLTYMYRWVDRKQNRKTIYAKTLDGLREEEKKIELEMLQGITRDNITLSEIIETYLDTKISLAASTYENYKYYFEKHIKNETVGKMKIIDIKKSDLLRYYTDKSRVANMKNGTIHILNKIIHPALQLAVEDDIIRKNPADGTMKYFQVESEKKYALSMTEEQEFLDRLVMKNWSKYYYPFFTILLYTGLRLSEALGLTWEDVDLKNKMIDINHQLQYRPINGKQTLYCIDLRKGEARTKTASGRRGIPMTPNVYEMFCEQRKIWLSMKKDPDFEVDGYKNFIFLSKTTGRNLYPVNIRKTLQRIVNMNDTREIQLPNISPHILRHTTCTRYAEAGMDIKTNQYLLGQSDVKTTIKVYNHVDMERTKRELARVEKWEKDNVDGYTKIYTNLQ